MNNTVERDSLGRFASRHYVPPEWARKGNVALQDAIKENPSILERRNASISKAKMGHTFTEESKEQIRQTLKKGVREGRIKPPTTKGLKLNSGAKISLALKGRPKPPFTEEHKKRIREARAKQDIKPLLTCSRPNKPEQFLIDFFHLHKLPFKYVGDGEFILGGKCPDFLNTNGKKQLIELFGAYWHPVFDVAKRTEFFKQYGFDTLVIWQEELEDTNKLLKKVTKFTRRISNAIQE